MLSLIAKIFSMNPHLLSERMPSGRISLENGQIPDNTLAK